MPARRWQLLNQYPVLRGMIAYAFIWPCCSLAQEYIEYGTSLKEADWGRAARFGFFGAFFMSPVFYGWLKFSQPYFRNRDLYTCIKRAAVEQVSYGPLALCYFLFGMSLLELKTIKESVSEVREKFWPTYTMGAVYWPTAQTINFRFVSEKNRIIFCSATSFVWTCYLAHVKSQPNASS